MWFVIQAAVVLNLDKCETNVGLPSLIGFIQSV